MNLQHGRDRSAAGKSLTSDVGARSAEDRRVLEELDARAVRIYRAYYFGEELDFDEDWVSQLFPEELPAWATLVLVTAIAGNRLCRMECIRCGATASPVQPEDHVGDCDYRSFDRPKASVA